MSFHKDALAELEQQARYLEDVAGKAPDLEPLAAEAANGAPVFLLHLYRLYGAKLFGRRLVLAVAGRWMRRLTGDVNSYTL